jgi:hypothetical protein
LEDKDKGIPKAPEEGRELSETEVKEIAMLMKFTKAKLTTWMKENGLKNEVSRPNATIRELADAIRQKRFSSVSEEKFWSVWEFKIIKTPKVKPPSERNKEILSEEEREQQIPPKRDGEFDSRDSQNIRDNLQGMMHAVKETMKSFLEEELILHPAVQEVLPIDFAKFHSANDDLNVKDFLKSFPKIKGVPSEAAKLSKKGERTQDTPYFKALDQGYSVLKSLLSIFNMCAIDMESDEGRKTVIPHG